MGDNNKYKSSKLGTVGGIIFISIGTVWILNNFGLINYKITNIFRAFYELWPILFIALGFTIIFRGNEWVKAFAWLAFAFVIFLYSVFIQQGIVNPDNKIFNMRSDVPYDDKTLSKSYKQSVPTDLVQAGSYPLEEEFSDNASYTANSSFNFGKANLSAGVDTKDLFSYVASEGGFFEEDVKIDSTRSTLHFKAGDSFSKVMPSFSLYFSNLPLWNIDMKGKEIKGELNFKDIRISRLNINSNMDGMNIILGADTNKVAVVGKQKKVTINIPKDSKFILKSDSMQNIDISGIDIVKNDESCMSKNFDKMKAHMEIELIGKVKSVNLRTY